MPVTYYERNLPHWLPEGPAIFLTWRLRGSLPTEVVRQLRKLEKEPGRQFLSADRKLDAAATDPRWLSDPEIAGDAETAIQRGAKLGHYVVHAYVVMPNHVHLLLEPRVPLRRITGGIKGSPREMPTERWGAPESPSGRMNRSTTGFGTAHNSNVFEHIFSSIL